MDITIFIIAISLAMDALAVSIAKGISLKGGRLRNAAELGFSFGLFQFIMPVIGYFAGISFSGLISSFDHWVAFGLLAFIGGKMIFESFSKEEKEEKDERVSFRMLLLLSIATSIDALAVGISFALLGADIWVSSAVIGITCAVISFFGFLAGKKLGMLFGKRFEFLGGAILIVIGIKILVEHSGL